jgi:hypothetical protein
MGKHRFKKLIVDGKEIFVFANSRIPIRVFDLTELIGIKLVESNYQERKKYVSKRK